MKKIVWRVAVLTAALTGCGGNVCSRSKSNYDQIRDKLKNCSMIAANMGSRPTDEQTRRCEDNVSKCTADDTKKLNAYYDCVEAVPACESGKETEFTETLLACKFPDLSTECGKVF
jgi:hypothetical protein